MSEAAQAVLDSETNKTQLLEEKEISKRRASQIKEKETAINNLSHHSESSRRSSMQQQANLISLQLEIKESNDKLEKAE